MREIENLSFTSRVLATTGGLSQSATAFYKRLASMLSDKWKPPYSTTISWLSCRISYYLGRSSIMCLRGARLSNSQINDHQAATVDLTIADSNLSAQINSELINSTLVAMFAFIMLIHVHQCK